VLDDEVDVAHGSRVLGEADPNSRSRELGIVFFNKLVSFITRTKVSDCSNGYRAVRTTVLPQLVLRQEQFHTSEFLIEAIKRGIPAKEIYIIHMAPETQFLLSGGNLQALLDNEYILKDSDGSYWLALYQKCVHLGCTVPFRDSCLSFKCPCHGSHYHVNGEYLDGPAPRSLDRFRISFDGGNVVVSTGDINSTVQSPEDTTRLIAKPAVNCV